VLWCHTYRRNQPDRGFYCRAIGIDHTECPVRAISSVSFYINTSHADSRVNSRTQPSSRYAPRPRRDPQSIKRGEGSNRTDDPYRDTADRLASQIQTQIDTIEGIDDKAEHLTRLIGILIGLVFSVLSLVVNADTIQLTRANLGTRIAFLLGVVCLLAAMGAAMVTYLNSRYRAGIHHSVGYYVSNKEQPLDFDVHIKRVCGSYATVIEQNKTVIEVNSTRFRRALYLLLVGVLFLTTAGSIYLGGFSEPQSWYGVVIAGILALLVAWYFFTGRYLTLEPVE